MARFFGTVGFEDEMREVRPGVHQQVAVERQYYGDVKRNNRQLKDGEPINNDLSVSNLIEILADAYADEHFHAIRYVKWAGANWQVTNVEVRSPRLILTLGGVYNGASASTPNAP